MREYDKDFKQEAIKLSYELGPDSCIRKARDSSHNALLMGEIDQNGMEK